jgi:hypothetical protein
MFDKKITIAAAILLGSTALASAQTLGFPRDRAYVDGYGYSFGMSGPGYDPHYGVAPAPRYYNYAPGYYYAPGYNNGWNNSDDNWNNWNDNW